MSAERLTGVSCLFYASHMDFNTMTRLCCRKPWVSHTEYTRHRLTTMQAIFGLRTDLNLLVGNRYSFAAAIFYIGFIAGAYPSMWLIQRYPVERVSAIIVAVWGVCLILTTQCTNYQGLYAQRFFLGALESGISPLFMVIVGSFYTKKEAAFRMG